MTKNTTIESFKNKVTVGRHIAIDVPSKNKVGQVFIISAVGAKSFSVLKENKDGTKKQVAFEYPLASLSKVNGNTLECFDQHGELLLRFTLL